MMSFGMIAATFFPSLGIRLDLRVAFGLVGDALAAGIAGVVNGGRASTK
jgi:hypothetical protein